jgi:hypothetical protein
LHHKKNTNKKDKPIASQKEKISHLSFKSKFEYTEAMAQELVEHSKRRSLLFIGIVIAAAAMVIALV